MELLVAVAIIGILSTIGGGVFDAAIKRTQDAEARETLSSIYTAEQSFHAEFGAYSTRFDQMGVKFEGNLHWDVGFRLDKVSVPFGASSGSFACTGLCGTVDAGACGIPCISSCPKMMVGQCIDVEGDISSIWGFDAMGQPSFASNSAFLVEAHVHFHGKQEEAETFRLDNNKTLSLATYPQSW